MDKNYIDFHCHVLPGMDFDGTDDLEETVAMCKLLKSQGVATVCATPHFYPWNDDVDAFLERREKTLATLGDQSEIEIIPGAEVRIFQSLAEYPIDRLCIGDSNVALFELPETRFEPWMVTAIENTVYKYSLIPVIAHIERYCFSKEILEKFARLPGVIFQITIGELAYPKTLKNLDMVCSTGVPVVLGSDAHDMTCRVPHFDIVEQIKSEKASLFTKKRVETKNAIIENCIYSQDILEKLIRTKDKIKV